MKKLAALLLVAGALSLIARAEDTKPATKKLALADPPKAWKARPPEAKSFVCDYDLPDDARVNVMRFAVSWDELRGKLGRRWKAKDGGELDVMKLPVEKREAKGGFPISICVLEGTHTPKDGTAKEGWALVAAHLDAPGGAWSGWLIGPAKAVSEHKAAYLEWLETARVVDAEESAMIREVRFVHGAPSHGVPGPWALTAWRIGQDALARFKIGRDKAWEISITHRSPKKVQYTCMLDGLLAATGASPGKMNLAHEEVDSEEKLETVIVHKPSKKTLTYRLTKEHVERIRPVEYADFPKAAADLEKRKAEELFTVEEK